MRHSDWFTDLSGVVFSQAYTNVHHSEVGRCGLTYYDADRFCDLHGATLATYSQLCAAWEDGLELCK